MLFATNFTFSSPQFSKIQHIRRKLRANICKFDTSFKLILSFSERTKDNETISISTRISTPLRCILKKFSHLLISCIFAISSVHVNDLAHAIVESNDLHKYPCEEIRSYYKGVNGLDGIDLIIKLNSIVSPHHSIPYKKVWDALKILDAADIDHPESSSEVIEIYTQRAVSKLLAGKPEGWNREHLWPRSYGLQKGPSRTDLHNIRPADSNVNSARGNKYFGECGATSARCQRPATREAAPDTETDNHKWAPPFQVRGDIARSIMYMAVCYAFHEPNDIPYLQLSNTPSIRKREMGLLSTLLEWNELDPPSESENLRNQRICNLYQHNRNPFIDHPEYANLIWRQFH
ncbi:hypothetical protein LUZ60_017485 [Juncus effusus]|nr:hypothetical protein LUZ60_017485 [Juncus effusus]